MDKYGLTTDVCHIVNNIGDAIELTEKLNDDELFSQEIEPEGSWIIATPVPAKGLFMRFVKWVQGL